MFKKKLQDVKLEIPGYCFNVDSITYYIYMADNEYQMYSQPVASLQRILESFTKSCAFVCCKDTGKIFQLYIPIQLNHIVINGFKLWKELSKIY